MGLSWQMQCLKNEKLGYKYIEILKLMIQIFYVKYWNINNRKYGIVQTSTKGDCKTPPAKFPAKTRFIGRKRISLIIPLL